jgi:hypothetical protein
MSSTRRILIVLSAVLYLFPSVSSAVRRIPPSWFLATLFPNFLITTGQGVTGAQPELGLATASETARRDMTASYSVPSEQSSLPFREPA